jgi:hypothetical protein
MCVSYVRGENGRTLIQKGRPSCALHVVCLEWLTCSACSRLRLWKLYREKPQMCGELVAYCRTEVNRIDCVSVN